MYDLTTGTAEKIEKCSRPDDSFEAVLRGEMEKVGWMYCPRSDALPAYFTDRASLPDHVLMTACEKDTVSRGRAHVPAPGYEGKR